MKELFEWLDANKIKYNQIDAEVVDIIGMGYMFYQDTEYISSIFRTNSDGETEFNCVEDVQSLLDEGINYVVFKFGNNWYYTDIRKEFKLNILKYVGERQLTKLDIPFINLGIHTPYEILNSSFSIKEWVKKAQYLGHLGIGICDYNTLGASFQLQNICTDNNLKYVFGYSLTFYCEGDKIDGKVYVQTQQGLRNLLRIQKAIMVDSETGTIDFDELIARGKGNVFVFGKLSADWIKSNEKLVKQVVESFDGAYFQFDLSEYKAERIDVEVLKSLKSYYDWRDTTEIELPPVLISDCYYLDKDDAKNKIILNKVASGAAHEQSDDQYFKDIDEHFATIEPIFSGGKHDPLEVLKEICANTLKIAYGFNARFKTTENYMPQYDMTPEEAEKYGTTRNMFNQLLEEGLNRLVPEADIPRYRKQMEYEKYIIESTNNIDYLLVQYDTVNWCRENGILVGCGRGSAAGSLLLYLLGITMVDPLKFNLIFERFLLPERAGLFPAQATIIGQDIESTNYMEIELEDGSIINIDCDSELMVEREGVEEPMRIYADELIDKDRILFDNRDKLFTIKEIQQ